MEKESVINNIFKAHNDELRMDLLKGYICNKGDNEFKREELDDEDDEDDEKWKKLVDYEFEEDEIEDEDD